MRLWLCPLANSMEDFLMITYHMLTHMESASKHRSRTNSFNPRSNPRSGALCCLPHAGEKAGRVSLRLVPS